jgi:hypothetical protein
MRGLLLRGLLLRGSSLTPSLSTGHWWLVPKPPNIDASQLMASLSIGSDQLPPYGWRSADYPNVYQSNLYQAKYLLNQPLLNQGQHLSLRPVGATSKPQRLAGSVDHVDHDIFRHSPPRQCLARSTVPSLGIVAQDTSAARRRWCPSVQPTESHLRRYLGYPRGAPPQLRLSSILNGF